MKFHDNQLKKAYSQGYSKYLILIYILALFILLFSCNKQPVSQDAGLNNIIVYGDTRSNHDVHRKIVKAILAKSPKIVFHSGDLVDNGNKKDQWDKFNDITSQLREVADLYPAAGNHELEAQLYYDNFTLPGNEKWYTVTYDNVLFIVLNSNLSLGADSEQYEWLEGILKNVDESIRFKAVLLHLPIYSTGYHYQDGLELRESIVPLFEKYGVDIVFSGHDHDYERLRKDGIYYIVSGGGGAPLRAQKTTSPYSQLFKRDYNFCVLNAMGDVLKVTVYDEDLDILDEFSLKKTS